MESVVEVSRPAPPSILFVTADRASSAELAQEIVQEAQDLVRLEVELAKRELMALAIQIGLVAAGALLVALAVLVALPVFLVLLWWNHVLGAAIWLGTYALVGLALALIGGILLRRRPLRRTLSSLEETKQWALRQIRSNDR